MDVRSAEHLDSVVVRRGQLGHGQRSVFVPHRQKAETAAGTSKSVSHNPSHFDLAERAEEREQIAIDGGVAEIC